MTKTYSRNANEVVTVTDISGNTKDEEIKVYCKNVQDETVPKLDATLEPWELTNENVTVTITSDKELKEVPDGWTLDEETHKTLTKTFEENKDETVTVKNTSDKEASIDISVQNIDKEVPTVTKSVYSPSEGTTNKIGKVTLTLSEEIQLPKEWFKEKEENTIYREYDANVEEDVPIKDLAGNFVYEPITIDNIYKYVPELEIEYSEKKLTRETVTVTITSDVALQEKGIESDWILSDDKTILTKVFDKSTSGPEFVRVLDEAENEGIARVIVENIDNEAPIVEATYRKEGDKERVTLETNEKIQEIAGWNLDETEKILYKDYTQNTEETTVVKDLVGNETEIQIEVTQIGQNNGNGNTDPGGNGGNGSSDPSGNNGNGSGNSGPSGNSGNDNGNSSSSGNSGNGNGNSSSSGNNGNNGSNGGNGSSGTNSGSGGDNTRAPSALPKTGQVVLRAIIGSISIIGIITFIKYKKLKDI